MTKLLLMIVFLLACSAGGIMYFIGKDTLEYPYFYDYFWIPLAIALLILLILIITSKSTSSNKSRRKY